MKKAMKKLMAALLAVAMLCAMAVPAMAANDGSITIGKAVDGETYTIYELFKLDSYNPESETYSYSVKDEWKTFFDTGNPGANYIKLTNGHPEWIAANKDADTTVAEFAKAALSWAKTNKIDPAQTAKKAAGGTVTYTGLELGYYLVDTSLGSLCDLTTTAPAANIEEKNDKPSIDKVIKVGEETKTENSAKIGDTVTYEVTITVQKGTTDYVLRDTMTEGLTFNDKSVQVNDATLTDEVGTLATSNVSPYTFTLTFENSYIQNFNAGDKIKVTYTATVNEKAYIEGNTSSGANTNSASLKFGDQATVDSTPVTTKVYQFDLVKVDGNSKKLLSGAQFKLFDAATDGNEIKLVKDGDGYRVATAAEITGNKTVEYIETTADKAIRISGLANDKTYYLEETKAPDGYNPLAERKEFNLKDSSTTTMVGNTWAAGNGGLVVENNAGATLPSTGGIGTTIFYVVGGGLMVAAAVLLITKKRMENK